MLAAVAALRQKFSETGIDVLCTNPAGVVDVAGQATAEDIDEQMKTERLLHFLLTEELAPMLRLAKAKRGEARVTRNMLSKKPGAAFKGKNGTLGGNDNNKQVNLVVKSVRAALGFDATDLPATMKSQNHVDDEVCRPVGELPNLFESLGFFEKTTRLPQVARVCVVGGGASGFYSAIACAERVAAAGPPVRVASLAHPQEAGILILVLHKVRISGGGRCNVTHGHGVLPAASYPRGQAKLLEALSARHGPLDSWRWFEQRGVALKTEADGRVFPVSDSSACIVGALTAAAEELGVQVKSGIKVLSIEPYAQAELISATSSSTSPSFGLADGPAATKARFVLTVESEDGIQQQISCGRVSGPAILRLSAWGAYSFQETDYKAKLRLNWLPSVSSLSEVTEAVLAVPAGRPGLRPPVRRKPLGEVSPWPGTLPARLWGRLLQRASESWAADNNNNENSSNNNKNNKNKNSNKNSNNSNNSNNNDNNALPLWEQPWGRFGKQERAERLAQAVWPHLSAHEVVVSGRRPNKEEFVTAGGVDWRQDLDWERMESLSSRGLHFAGEAVDVDGITGGFNFQGCWSTGYAAGTAAADELL
ncbi:unnamed protein product [Polarella glacialis]|uniref:RsdA/BaiN/AoA(So)-like Rossmann fold-like domain-containing protein n=1 Tax=Polarella glacialis TaxID=89957 RepID=A0A813FKJ9_POLGL|nr:unnamed protein product [Polarella glacialis]